MFKEGREYDRLKNWTQKYGVSHSTVQKKLMKGISLKEALFSSRKIYE